MKTKASLLIIFISLFIIYITSCQSRDYKNYYGTSYGYTPYYKTIIGRYRTHHNIEIFEKHWLRMPNEQGEIIPKGAEVDLVDYFNSKTYSGGNSWWSVRYKGNIYKLLSTEKGLTKLKRVRLKADPIAEPGKKWSMRLMSAPNPDFFRRLSAF